jgi:hypothetical protein
VSEADLSIKRINAGFLDKPRSIDDMCVSAQSPDGINPSLTEAERRTKISERGKSAPAFLKMPQAHGNSPGENEKAAFRRF